MSLLTVVGSTSFAQGAFALCVVGAMWAAFLAWFCGDDGEGL